MKGKIDKNTRRVPLGAFDYLPSETKRLETVERKLEESYFSCGYSKVDTPIIEYFDSYRGDVGGIPQASMFKMSDFDGNLLVLRPDLTIPMMRVAATKLFDCFPQKLCYTGKVFDASVGKTKALQAREYVQSGVEYIGCASVFADVEVIKLAIDSLLALGLNHFSLELGHVGFFRAIMKELGADEDTIQDIRRIVSGKSTFEVDNASVSDEIKSTCSAFPMLFGGVEVLDKAHALCQSSESEKALRYLGELYGILDDLGYAKYVTIDLGLLQDIDYYTGIVFRGYFENCGSPVLNGGRYDNVSENYGKKLPSVGFAIWVLRVLEAMNVPNDYSSADIAVMTNRYDKKLDEYVESLRVAHKVDVYFGDNEAEFERYCDLKNIRMRYNLIKAGKAE